MYEVISEAVKKAVVELPAAALPSFAEVCTLLEVAPWNGRSYHPDRPHANMLVQTFGRDGRGMVVYFVLEQSRKVVLVQLQWLG